MKKLLTLVLALAMTLSLAACGGGGEDTADEGSEGSTSGEPTKMTLILRGGAYGESLEASLAPFEAEHNVDIEVMLMSFDDLHTGIALDAVNEVGTYDLCMVDGSWMAEFTENGVLANLSEMGYSFDDDIIPATTTICKVGEDIYLAPYYGNVTVMMYNKQLLADAGYAPEDIDSFADLMDIAQKTKAADSNKNGFLIRGGSADNILSDFLPHLVVHGGWVVDENNNPTVDTPEFKAAMQEYLDLYALGSTLDKDDIVASVTSGETALAQIWPGWYTPTADGPANYTTIPTKLTDDSAPVDAVALQGVWCIGIPDNAPHKDLALELLEYVMSPEVQLASIENNGVPCRYSCLTDSTVLETYPHLQTVCGALETGVYRPVIEEWTEFTNILGTEMDNIIQGTKTMDEALAYAQEQLEQLTYRSKKEIQGQVRIVRFPGADTCACCGTHVRQTGEIGLVKLLSVQHFRSGCRIEMLSGERAFNWLSRMSEQNRLISGLLSAKPAETAAAVQRLLGECASLKEQLAALRSEQFAALAAQYAGKGDVLLFAPQPDAASVRRLCVAVMERCGGLCLVCSGSDDSGYQYAVGQAGGDVRAFVKRLNGALGGRGGGRDAFFAQGSLPACEAAIRAFWETRSQC